MCTLSLNAERVLVKLTDGVTAGCHLTCRMTSRSLHLKPWAFKKLSVRGYTLSSRNNHIDKHLAFMMLKCVFSINLHIFSSYCPCQSYIIDLFHRINQKENIENTKSFEDWSLRMSQIYYFIHLFCTLHYLFPSSALTLDLQYIHNIH